MIIVMQSTATEAQIQAVVEAIRARGVEPLVLPGEGRVAIGIPAALSGQTREAIEAAVGRLDGVNKLTNTSRPYKLAGREFHPQDSIVEVKGVQWGGTQFPVIAGPCSVEGYEPYLMAAKMVQSAGGRVLRGGAFKPRTSPYSFQGLKLEGLEIIKQVGDETGLVTITEVMSADMVETVCAYVDILQIGARSMQNFPLLIEAGKSGKPVFLKRGPSASIDEFLLAAEYVLNEGNPNVILCERGVIPIDRTYVRNTLDVAAVPVLRHVSHLPVVVDPSHGTGKARFVAPMAKASMAAGAHGLMIEVHHDPSEALSDGSQALLPDQYARLVQELTRLGEFLGVQVV